MEQSSFSATSRRNADKNLRALLLAGLGGSIVFHAAAIAGASQLWQPTAAIDEPMEITMVDVDKPVPAPVTPSPAPIVKPAPPAPKIITPQPKQAIPIVKAPAKVNLQPKPAPKVVTPALDKPIPIVKTKASLTANPAAKPNRPIDKTASKPVVAPKRASTPAKPVVAPAFPDELFRSTPQPAPTNKAPRPQQTAAQPKTANNERVGTLSGGGGGLAGKMSRNIDPGGSGGNAGNDGDFGAVAPSKIGASGGDSIGSTSNQSGLASNSSGSAKSTRGFGGSSEVLTSTGNDGDFGTVAPRKIGAPSDGDGIGSASNQSGLAGNSSGGGRLTRGFGGGSGGGSGGGNGTGSGSGNGSGNGIGGGGSDGDFGTVAQGKTWRGARNNPGNESGNSGSSSGSGDDDSGGGGVFGLQCIKRCEISGLTDLEDRDGGKDKLRIKIAIDPNGNVTRASIAKSSGNSTIDRIVINGVKQMQFNPPGKIVERVVKANILL